MLRHVLCLSLVCCLAAADSAHAETLSSKFSATVAGIRAGTVELRGTEAAGRYEVQGAAASSGLVGEFVRFTVQAAAAGSVRNGRYAPSSYTEVSQSREGTQRVTYRYRGGIPQIDRSPDDEEREPHHVGPEGQRGTLDPLTALWALLRDQPRASACAADVSAYNGETRSRLRLTNVESEGATLVCSGLYTRIAGFSDEEMAERVNWPFTLIYRETGETLLRVEELRIPTSFGLFRLVRQ